MITMRISMRLRIRIRRIDEDGDDYKDDDFGDYHYEDFYYEDFFILFLLQ
jgi:hypothetical protein